ncbi:hypothetical protein AKN88_08930 [Thiopseudomonas alkaliphila]|uniref:Glycosyltransferase involved in cell wall biosynthesis n=2 Tax=Thiopseudomonas alkaliphila TaxID=1697053 RepID=A0A0K1XHI4_9GAMM|nr:hypothetical protein AKN88_08930 [Thiopseudomonas alkaliphila]
MLVLSNMYPSKEDPVYGVFVEKFCKQMSGEGICVDVVSIKGRGRGFLSKAFKYISYFFAAIFKLKYSKYDVVYVHYIGHTLIPFLFFYPKNKTVILNAHGGDVFPISKLSNYLQKIFHHIILKADLIVVPSCFFKREVGRVFGVPNDKIFVSPSCGITVSSTYKKQNDLSGKNGFVVGYVSRVDKDKGWDDFLNMTYILKNEYNIPCSAVLIGGGAEYQKMLNMIDRLGLKNDIELKGFIPNSELPNYYAKMDLFVFPTRLEESLGLVGLESMAEGTPVIGSKIGALAGYIKNDENGYCYSPGDVQELALLASEFFKLDLEKRKEMSVKAHSTALKYDEFNVSRSMKDKIYEVCTQKE